MVDIRNKATKGSNFAPTTLQREENLEKDLIIMMLIMKVCKKCVENS